MDSDDARLWLSSGAAMVLTIPVALLAFDGYGGGQGENSPRMAFYFNFAVIWSLMYAGYIALTWWTYSRHDHRGLVRRLRTVSRGGSSRALQWWGLGMGGPLSWTLTTTVGAMLLVVAVMIDPAARHDLVLRMVCVGLVIASWGALVTAQALAYARADAQHGGIDFEGSPEPVFGDYLSLAVFISAMFGTGDARCSGTRLRSTIRAHVLVAFGFNSMVVATLATLLLTA